MRSKPLSGPTSRLWPARTTSARRSVPTPGSTTATWTAAGKYGTVWASTTDPRAHVLRGHQMRDVEDAHVRGECGQNPVAGRHEAVCQPVVGQQAHDAVAKPHPGRPAHSNRRS